MPKVTSGTTKVIDAQTFFKVFPRNVDSQIESRGGSMEPLERAGGTATALADMTKKFSAIE